MPPVPTTPGHEWRPCSTPSGNGHCGSAQPVLGSRMKLVNNVLLAFTAEGVANSFALAHRLGLEAASVIEAFDGGPLVSPWESGKFRRIAQGEYSEEFALALALKDVQLALSEVGPDRFPVLASLAGRVGGHSGPWARWGRCHRSHPSTLRLNDHMAKAGSTHRANAWVTRHP